MSKSKPTIMNGDYDASLGGWQKCVPLEEYRQLEREQAKLLDAINSTWIEAYPDCSKCDDINALTTRVSQLGSDRRIWLDNHQALQKGYNKLDIALRLETERLDCLFSEVADLFFVDDEGSEWNLGEREAIDFYLSQNGGAS